MLIIVICLLMENKFCLGSISDGFSATESGEVSLN